MRSIETDAELPTRGPELREGDEAVQLAVTRAPGQATTPRALRPSLFICTPCYGGMCMSDFTRSLAGALVELSRHNIDTRVWNPYGDSYISRLRNRAVAEFLADERATHLLFIDSDIGFQPNDIASLLVADEDVVCGAYPMKTINWKAVAEAVRNGTPHESLARDAAMYPVNLFHEELASGQLTAVKRHGRTYVRVQDAATGFLLISRRIIEKIIRDFGSWLTYTTDYEPHGVLHHRLFDGGEDPASPRVAARTRLEQAACTGTLEELQERAVEYAAAMQNAQPGRYLTEDYFFSRLVQLVGGHIWMCIDIELTHTGAMTFRGNLDRVFPFRGGSREGAVERR